MPVKILIADDHILFNDGLKSLLETENRLHVHGQVYRGTDVLEFIEKNKTDLVLLDINLPGINGLDLADQIIKHYPGVLVIMITMYTDAHFVQTCKKHQVPGYILKNASRTELLAGIYAVLNGETYYDSKLCQEGQHKQDDFVRKFNLTKREMEIFTLLKETYTNQQIAEKLFLSIFTVETHRRNINLKLGIKNPTDLMRFVFNNDL